MSKREIKQKTYIHIIQLYHIYIYIEILIVYVP
jgi:hypothetical protein